MRFIEKLMDLEGNSIYKINEVSKKLNVHTREVYD